MRSKDVISILLIILFLSTILPSLFAQEQEEQGNVFAISFLTFPREEEEAFFKLWETEVLPIEKQIDEILSTRVFIHWWGPKWNVMLVREYKDLASMEKALQKTEELSKKKYPDEKERAKITKKIRKFLDGHYDAIVREFPKLRK